jgi:hypothetical protein
MVALLRRIRICRVRGYGGNDQLEAHAVEIFAGKGGDRCEAV